MKRLLLLAYYFPPTGGAGTQRSLAFARHLPAFGWEPVVMTGPAIEGDRWTPVDGGLLSGLDPCPEIIRVPGRPPPPSGRTRARAERWLRADSPFSRWWAAAVQEAAAAVPDVQAVVATMSPYESGAIAARLAADLGVPWVADLRDPWALDEVLIFPTGMHRRLELAQMRRVLAAADGIVMNTPEAARAVREFDELRGANITVIPNGYEPADFAAPGPARDDDRFRIVHTGYLHTEMGERHRRTARLRRIVGGVRAEVDLLTRSHVFLLEAVRRLRERDPALGDRIEVHLAGVTSEADLRLADAPGVHVRGYMPHDDSVALMRSADLLFLPMQDLPEGVRSRIVPGKTYEYLASGRPILAAVPDGDARDLVGSAPGNWVCRPADVDGMAEAIAAEARIARENKPRAACTPAGYERYSRQELTRELAELLDGLNRSAEPRPLTRTGV